MLELHKLADRSGPTPDFANGETWPMAGMELVGKAPKKHNFSDDLVNRGAGEGWLEIVEPRAHHTAGYSRGTVVTGAAIRCTFTNAVVVYRIDQAPGRYDGEESHEYRCTLVSSEEA